MAPTEAATGHSVSEASQLGRAGGSDGVSVATPHHSISSSASGNCSETPAGSSFSPSVQLSSSAGTEVAGGGHQLTPAAPAAIARAAAARQAAARQAAIASRAAGVRSKASRSAAAAAEQPGKAGETHADPADSTRGKSGSSGPTSLVNSEASPTGKSGRCARAPRLGADGGVTSVSATTTEVSSSRSLRRAAGDASGTGAAGAITHHAAPGVASAGGDELTVAVDYRGLRRSLRQAILATSGKAQFPGTGAGCPSSGTDGQASSSAAAAGPVATAAAATAAAGGGGALGGPTAGSGRRRMRQPQRQLLQSYVVGQQDPQVGPQEKGQEGPACLAEWLGIEGSTACCCCGSGCYSCSTTSFAKSGTITRSNSNQTAAGFVSRAGSSGGATRSALDVYTAATKGQKQQQICGAAQQEETCETDEGILVGPSWFEARTETETPFDFCSVRPTSPSRFAAFSSQQEKWEAEDFVDSAESAVATAGTPWPKGSTSCSFGGYGAATRNGGVLPLCCYCGLPLRPPASGSSRGAGAESGCPLSAAAAAVAALGLEGWNQWCRCCTRVYGDLRLQQQRNASWLPFSSFVVPKAPLRYVLMPADGAKDAPGGAASVAAAIAAVAAVDSRRCRAADDGVGAAVAAAAEGDSESAPVSAIGNGSSTLRRTRSGQHFCRAPPLRSSGRSNNPTDITRFRGASCCWPSSTSKGSFVQPIARLQQQLTHLQQQADLPQPHSRISLPKSSNSSVAQTAPDSSVPGVGTPPAVIHAEVIPATALVAAEGPPAAAAAAEHAASAAGAEAAGVVAAARLEDPSIAPEKPEEKANNPGATCIAAPKISSTAVPVATGENEKHLGPIASPVLQVGTGRAGTEGSQSASRAVVVPRVYLESSTSCYVATAFDAVRAELLQKRFCCLILGEQRAHALACQWLRWVHRYHASAAHKQRLLRAQLCNAATVQTPGLSSASPTLSQISDCPAALATAASPGRKLVSVGSCGARRISQRGAASTQIQPQESLRGDRLCKRRRRGEEGLDVSDAEGTVEHSADGVGD